MDAPSSKSSHVELMGGKTHFFVCMFSIIQFHKNGTELDVTPFLSWHMQTNHKKKIMVPCLQTIHHMYTSILLTMDKNIEMNMMFWIVNLTWCHPMSPKSHIALVASQYRPIPHMTLRCLHRNNIYGLSHSKAHMISAVIFCTQFHVI